MNFNKKDLVHVDNLMGILRSRAKFTELDGNEVLAAADALHWFAAFKSALESKLKDEEEKKATPVVPEEIKSPIEEPVKREKKKKE